MTRYLNDLNRLRALSEKPADWTIPAQTIEAERERMAAETDAAFQRTAGMTEALNASRISWANKAAAELVGKSKRKAA